jgi:hypothetical protein
MNSVVNCCHICVPITAHTHNVGVDDSRSRVSDFHSVSHRTFETLPKCVGGGRVRVPGHREQSTVLQYSTTVENVGTLDV